MANYQVVTASVFVQALPDNKRRLANVILMKGQNVKHALRASADASHSSTRALASVVTLRRPFWLCSSSLAVDTKLKWKIFFLRGTQ